MKLSIWTVTAICIFANFAQASTLTISRMKTHRTSVARTAGASRLVYMIPLPATYGGQTITTTLSCDELKAEWPEVSKANWLSKNSGDDVDFFFQFKCDELADGKKIVQYEGWAGALSENGNSILTQAYETPVYFHDNIPLVKKPEHQLLKITVSGPTKEYEGIIPAPFSQVDDYFNRVLEITKLPDAAMRKEKMVDYIMGLSTGDDRESVEKDLSSKPIRSVGIEIFPVFNNFYGYLQTPMGYVNTYTCDGNCY